MNFFDDMAAELASRDSEIERLRACLGSIGITRAALAGEAERPDNARTIWQDAVREQREERASVQPTARRFKVDNGPGGLRLVLTAVRDGVLTVDQAMEQFVEDGHSHQTSEGRTKP